MKRTIIMLLALTLVCSAVYAKTYKISPQKNQSQQGQTASYNVYTPSTYTSQQVQNGVEYGGIIEFVIDFSGSMSSVIDKAKYTVQHLYPSIPSGTKVGLRVFGQNGGINPYTYEAPVINKIAKAGGKYKISVKQQYDCVGNTKGGCSNTIQVLPVGLYNGNVFYQAMSSQRLGGSTPLVFGLHLAVTKDLANFPATSKKKIILITDGGENCSGDPCAFARKIAQERPDIIIDVIVIGGGDSMACLANETNGRFYKFSQKDFYNGSFDYIFMSTLMQSIQTAPQVPNKETPNTEQQTTQPANGNKYENIPD